MPTDRRRRVPTLPVCTVLLATTSLWGCGPSDGPAVPDRARLSKAGSVADVGGMATLVAAAKAEGRLNAIAMPSGWADYGEIIARFEERYGIDVVVENPDGSSEDVIQALKEDREAGKAVDVVEVGIAQAQSATREGLFAGYRIERHGDVAPARRDVGSAWYANYGGYVSIGCALAHVQNCPTTFKDLLKPEYRNKVTLNGDPTRSSSALAGVFAAALANGGSFDDIGPGVDLFAKLAKTGNLTSAEPNVEAIKNGVTPIVITWDFKATSYWQELINSYAQWTVTVPRDGVVSGYYATAVSRRASHPAAARLWQEYLFSDEAQNFRLKGFARPVLMEQMEKKGSLDVISSGWLPKLPFDQPAFPSSVQLARAKAVVGDRWKQRTAPSS